MISDTKIYVEAKVRAQEMLEKGSAGREVLKYLTSVAEAASGDGAVCSILKLDDEGLLRNAASPKLPADYLKAIDRLKPRADLGTCASAAATGSIVITPDFCADNKWAELKHLPLALGFTGAWSCPIKTPEDRVLGTFGTYYREKRKPSEVELEGVKILADVAASAMLKEHGNS